MVGDQMVGGDVVDGDACGWGDLLGDVTYWGCK